MLSDNRLVIWCNETTFYMRLLYGDDGDSGTGYGDHMFHHLEHKRHHTRFRSHNEWLSWKYILLFQNFNC